LKTVERRGKPDDEETYCAFTNKLRPDRSW
jgi:hypothetical protein